MTLPFTSVVSYHTTPMTCGVAKFSSMLAERLGVPFVGIGGEWGGHPLLSLKWSECRDEGLPMQSLRYSVFWHDAGHEVITKDAEMVFYADPSLGAPGLWCPSMIPVTPKPVQLFSFGMAHKLQTAHYAKVRTLLDAAEKRYHLRVSVGLHEGTSLSDATQHFDDLNAIMGAEHVTILGCLSDAAVSEELHKADYVLAFFEGGVKRNNTTVHAALEHDTPVITNGAIDYAFNIESLAIWPTAWNRCYSWDHLIARMEELCAVST